MNVTIVSYEADWEGIYIGDSLFRQNHSISKWDFKDALDQLGGTFKQFHVRKGDDDQLDQLGECPKFLHEVKFA